MGETSAKRMRGGEMDDVIFGGTHDAPRAQHRRGDAAPRQQRHNAPGPYDEEDEIEVARRIERGAGSGYRVNGREVRARDVQLLFADAATRRAIAAMVSQGRIGAIINAKPADRRAPPRGGRRHRRAAFAPPRGRAASQGRRSNLARLDDVLTTLATQLDGLKKQARQAQRYRRALGAYPPRRSGGAASAAGRPRAPTLPKRPSAAARRRARRRRPHRRRARRRARARGSGRGACPTLRQAEAAAAAELQRLVLARRRSTRRSAASPAHAQAARAAPRADSLPTRARGGACRRCRRGDRAARRRARRACSPRRRAKARPRREAAAALAAAQRTTSTRSTPSSPAAPSRSPARGRAARARSRARRGSHRARARGSTSAGDEVRASARRARRRSRSSAPRRAEPKRRCMRSRSTVEASRAAAEAAAAGTARGASRARRRARAAAGSAEARRAKLEAETQALNELLAAGERQALAAGARRAYGRAGLRGGARRGARRRPHGAARQRRAPVHWHGLPAYAYELALPGDARRLGSTCDGAAGAGAAPGADRHRRRRGARPSGCRAPCARPAPGHAATADCGAGTGSAARRARRRAAAQRLRQRNRLAELDAGDARAPMPTPPISAAGFETAQDARAAQRARPSARRARRCAQALAVTGRGARPRGRAAARPRRRSPRGAWRSRKARRALPPTRRKRPRANAGASGARRAPRSGATSRRRSTTLRLSLAERRGADSRGRATHDRLKREAALRGERLAAIAREIDSWRGRAERRSRQRARIEERATALRTESRAARPPAGGDCGGSATAGGDHRGLDPAPQRGGRRAGCGRDRARAGRSGGERSRCGTRQRRARSACAAKADRDQARDASRRGRGCASPNGSTARPTEILASPASTTDETLPELADAEARFERLTRERDNMGPVNLVAETEAAEIEARSTA